MTFGPLVTADWVADEIGAPDLKIIDGSWRMPGNGAAIDDYRAQHIPGAVFFDLDAIADTASALPHMLPAPAAFETAVGALGVNEKDRIVVYDDKGVFSAARVWWTFRAMGHEQVAVMNGGLPAWLDARQRTTADTTVITPTKYHARPKPALCVSADDVRDALGRTDTKIIDARPADRFFARAPEPRPGLRSGHMPGAATLPFARLQTPRGAMLPPEALRAVFLDTLRDAPDGTRVITSCGSGITAAILSLGLEIIGWPDHVLYDGSWAEWAEETHDPAIYPVVGQSA